VLLARVARRRHRPLLNQGDPREILDRLIALRHPVYAEADLTVESLAAPAEMMVERVLAALGQWVDASGVVDRPPEHPRSAMHEVA
jgi:shikimate kinase